MVLCLNWPLSNAKTLGYSPVSVKFFLTTHSSRALCCTIYVESYSYFLYYVMNSNKSFEILVINLTSKFISDFWQTHLVTFQSLTHKRMDVFVPAWKLCKIQKISRSLCMSYLFCFFVLRLSFAFRSKSWILSKI